MLVDRLRSRLQAICGVGLRQSFLTRHKDTKPLISGLSMIWCHPFSVGGGSSSLKQFSSPRNQPVPWTNYWNHHQPNNKTSSINQHRLLYLAVCFAYCKNWYQPAYWSSIIINHYQPGIFPRVMIIHGPSWSIDHYAIIFVKIYRPWAKLIIASTMKYQPCHQAQRIFLVPRPDEEGDRDRIRGRCPGLLDAWWCGWVDVLIGSEAWLTQKLRMLDVVLSMCLHELMYTMHTPIIDQVYIYVYRKD